MLTLGVLWYVRRRKQGRGSEELWEDGKGQPVSSVPNPARATMPYYVSRLSIPLARWLTSARSFPRTLMTHRPGHPQWLMVTAHRLSWVPSLPSADLTVKVCTLTPRNHDQWSRILRDPGRGHYTRPGALWTGPLSSLSFCIPLFFSPWLPWTFSNHQEPFVEPSPISFFFRIPSSRLRCTDVGMDFIYL